MHKIAYFRVGESSPILLGRHRSIIAGVYDLPDQIQ